MKLKQLSLLFILLFVFASCKKNRFEIDTDKVDLNIKIERFDKDLMALDTTKLDQGIGVLEKKYGDFFPRFATNVILLGSPDSAKFKPQLKAFMRDSMIREVYKESESVFANVSDIQKEVNNAFKYVKYYFPDKKIPRVAMHVSGFNQSIVATKDLISISIDNYLGADYAPYKNIAYAYQLQNMTRSKVAPDILLGYLMSEFPFESNSQLLASIISRGKILYIQSVFMPQRSEADIMGYTPKQEDWCVKNEKNMWGYIVENKHLYSTSQLIAAKYVNPAPFTTYFSEDSPGQGGIWLGLQIVKSYMKNNSDVTLPQLLKEKDYQKLLEDSKYKP